MASKAVEFLKSIPVKPGSKPKPTNVLTIAAESDPKLLSAVAAVEDAVKSIVIPEPQPHPEQKDYSKQFAAVAMGLGQVLEALKGLKPEKQDTRSDAEILKALRDLAKVQSQLLEAYRTPKELILGEDGEAIGSRLMVSN